MWADGNTKTEAFSEKLQRGAGVIFNPKIFVADSWQGFMSMKLIEKIVLWLSKNEGGVKGRLEILPFVWWLFLNIAQNSKVLGWW